jgi:hypothetical protein
MKVTTCCRNTEGELVLRATEESFCSIDTSHNVALMGLGCLCDAAQSMNAQFTMGMVRISLYHGFGPPHLSCGTSDGLSLPNATLLVAPRMLQRPRKAMTLSHSGSTPKTSVHSCQMRVDWSKIPTSDHFSPW